MSRRRTATLALTLFAALAWPAAAPAAQSNAQREFRSRLLHDSGVSAYVKSRLRHGGFVDRHILFADLTGEGKSDAVVLVHSGASAGRIAMYVFSSLKASRLRIVYKRQALFRASARLLKPSRARPRGAIVLREPIYDPGDELCCPGAHRDSELRWSTRSRRFKVVSSEVVDHVNGRFCSRTNPTYCISALRRRNGIFLSMRSATLNGGYQLCVIDPAGSRVCHSFTLRRRGDNYFSRVRWQDHFPNSGRGRYHVYWRHGGHRLRRTLAFRRH